MANLYYIIHQSTSQTTEYLLRLLAASKHGIDQNLEGNFKYAVTNMWHEKRSQGVGT
jgi:hypothetical protein